MALGNYHYQSFLSALQQLMQSYNITNGMFVSIREKSIDTTVFAISKEQRENRRLEQFADLIDSFHPLQLHKLNLN